MLGHVTDTERVFGYRLLRISRGDRTPLAAFDEDAYVPAGRFDARPLRSLMDEFRDSFSTARLDAERLTTGHWDDLRRMDQDPRFMAELGGVRDAVGTLAYLERNLAHWGTHGFGLWMLRARETGAVIGRAVLRHLEVDGIDEVETGYGFLPELWGRGLATEIARACVRIGREQLGLASLVGITLPTNAASQRVLRKAGLQYERDIVHAGLPHLLFRSDNSS